MRIHRFALLAVITAILATLPLPLMAQDETSGEQVVLALDAALNAGDVDLAMTYIADNAVFGGEFAGVDYSVGAEEIRADFEKLIAVNFHIEEDVIAVHGEGQIIITEARTWNDVTIEMGVAPLEFTEVYFVRDGQVFGIGYAAWAATDERFLTAMAAMAPPPVVAEDIIGTWRLLAGGFHFQFRSDGTYRASTTVGDLNSDTPQDIGTYTVEDGVLTITSSEITEVCHDGEAGVYALSFRDDGALGFFVESEGCEMRRPSSPKFFNRIEDAP